MLYYMVIFIYIGYDINCNEDFPNSKTMPLTWLVYSDPICSIHSYGL